MDGSSDRKMMDGRRWMMQEKKMDEKGMDGYGQHGLDDGNMDMYMILPPPIPVYKTGKRRIGTGAMDSSRWGSTEITHHRI